MTTSQVVKRFAPFVKHEFDLIRVPALSQVELLLDADPSLVVKIPDIVKEIGTIDRGDYGDRLDVLLFQMWRAGLSDPVRVCEEFQRFKGAWWYSGHFDVKGVSSCSKGTSFDLTITDDPLATFALVRIIFNDLLGRSSSGSGVISLDLSKVTHLLQCT